MTEPLLLEHGGYRKLKSFKVAQPVYDATARFCERTIDKRSLTRDQMVQAARSGVQNIAEGWEKDGHVGQEKGGHIGQEKGGHIGPPLRTNDENDCDDERRIANERKIGNERKPENENGFEPVVGADLRVCPQIGQEKGGHIGPPLRTNDENL